MFQDEIFKCEPQKTSRFYRSHFCCLRTLMKFTTPVDSELASLALQYLKGHMSHTYVLLASDFHGLWHRVMTISLLTEVKLQWAKNGQKWAVSTWMGDRLSLGPAVGCI